MPTLILFDIDGTMILTGGAGIAAMHRAGQDLYGPDFTAHGIDFAGRLDPLLVSEMLHANGVEPSPAQHARFRARYRERLLERPLCHDSKGYAGALPGVCALLDELGRMRRHTLGVLTGNYQECARIKLAACGINPDQFSVSVWGDESPHSPPHRDHLPPLAIARCAALLNRPVTGREVVIIGDTPHDVQCARVSGCASIGVATGRFSASELTSAGADLALENLSDTRRVLSWLTDRTQR